ncbi:MAG: endo alpha-1,4 polygalactosaminidase [bacterium]
MILSISQPGCNGSLKKQRSQDFNHVNSWICNYKASVAPTHIDKFDLAVLDADSHPDLTWFKNSDTILIGYVSLGEVGKTRWYWNVIRSKPWILDKNPNWGSRMIDVREKEWHDWLLQCIIPKILKQGFAGLFLDTIDNAEYLEKYHPSKKYPGAQAAMIQLIKSIRAKYPHIYLIANRGFSLLHSIGPVIDAVVAESLFTTIDFDSDSLGLRGENESEPIVTMLKRAKRKFHLTIFTLDYVKKENRSIINSILARSRLAGFKPYISTPNLDEIYFYSLE